MDADSNSVSEPEYDIVDWYCIVCGGPFHGLAHDQPYIAPQYSYDPQVIGPQEAEWTQAMYIVGRWPVFPYDSLSFIAPAADVEEICDGWIQVTPEEPDTEARYPGPNPLLLDRQSAAHDVKTYFPVHPPCLELFGFHMTGRQTSHRDFLGLDSDALWLAFYLFNERCSNELILPYGLARDCQGELWLSKRGYEFVAANPKLDWAAIDSKSAPPYPVTSELRAFIANQASIAATRTVIPPETATELSSKVKTDPFGNLPLELLFKITERLDDSSLFALCSASWTAHSVLRANNQFWRHRIRHVSMPWLFEVFPLLDDDNLMKEVDTKALLCGLDGLTQPKVGMRGTMMGVANRRRIWGACEAVAGVYAEAVVALPGLLGGEKSLGASVHTFDEEDYWYKGPAAAEGDNAEVGNAEVDNAEADNAEGTM